MSAVPQPPPTDMDDDLAERVARRVVEMLAAQSAVPSVSWLDATAVAERYGVSRAFVYDHARDLGAVPLGALGDGRRPRLRFDPESVAAYFRQSAETPATRAKPRRRTQRRPRAGTTASGAPLLEVRERGAT